MSDDTFTTRAFVHIGYAFNDKKQVISGWREIATDGTLLAERWFLSKGKLKDRLVGGVYSIEASGKTIKPDTIAYAGRSWSNIDDIVAWRLSTDTTVMRDRIAKIEKRDKARDVVSEALAPLMKLYQATDPIGRRAIEVLILDKLRRGI